MSVAGESLNGRSNLQTLLREQLEKDFAGRGFPNGDRGQALLCVADFSGAHRSALFNTYAFLALDLDKSGYDVSGDPNRPRKKNRSLLLGSVVSTNTFFELLTSVLCS